MKYFRTPYDDAYNSDDFATIISHEPGAIQSAKDDCDLNIIFERHTQGMPIPINDKNPVFDEEGTYLDYLDYRENLDRMIAAEKEFRDTVPAKIRKHYGNDPGEFLAAIEKQDEYLYETGYLKKNDSVKTVEG